MFRPGETVCVSIEGFTYVTSGRSLYESVSNAIDTFGTSWWKGPKPTPDTVYKIRVISSDKRWTVTAAQIEKWRSDGRPIPAKPAIAAPLDAQSRAS